LVLARIAHGDAAYPDLIWLRGGDIVSGRILSEGPAEIVAAVPGGETWHIQQDRVSQVQHNINRRVFRPTHTSLGLPRQQSLVAAAITLGVVGAILIGAGGAQFVTTGPSARYPWVPQSPPPDTAHREAGGICFGVGGVFAILSVALGGASR